MLVGWVVGDDRGRGREISIGMRAENDLTPEFLLD
jgi:hypothetical protein